MNTLWTFGDSFTEEFNTEYPWGKKYIEFKGYVPKVYAQILAQKLNLNLKNFGKGGSDNYTIFQSFCNVSDLIDDSDVVIFGWTSPLRFRLVTKTGNWESILPNWKLNHKSIDDVTERTINEILINRDHDKFIDEVNSWIKLITQFLKKNKVTVIHWNADNMKINSKFIFNVEKIKVETNGVVDDAHFSENGHIELSNILFNLIKTKDNNLL